MTCSMSDSRPILGLRRVGLAGYLGLVVKYIDTEILIISRQHFANGQQIKHVNITQLISNT